MSAPHFCRLVTACLACLVGTTAAGPPGPAAKPGTPRTPPRVDRHGDPLPPGAVARFGTLRWRSPVRSRAYDHPWSLAYSSDGKMLVTAHISKGDVYVWGTETGKELPRLSKKAVGNVVALSPDGKFLYSAESSPGVIGGVRRRNLRTGEEQWFDPRRGSYEALAVSPDGSLVAAGGPFATVLWDARQGTPKFELKGQPARALAFSPDGKFLAAVGGQGVHTPEASTISLWNLGAKRLVRNLAGHQKRVLSIAYAPDGKTLASASVDGTIRIWDVETGRQFHSLPTQAHNQVAFSPRGGLLASCGSSNIVHLWDTATGKPRGTIPVEEGWLRLLAFSPDGKRLVTTGTSPTIHVCDVAARKELFTFPGHRDGVVALAFSPDGKTLASRGFDLSVRLWDRARATELHRFRYGTDQFSSSGFPDFLLAHSLAFFPDGKGLAASRAPEKAIGVWDVASRKERFTLATQSPNHRGPHSVAISPDGALLISPIDGRIRAWSAATGKEDSTFDAIRGEPLELVFCPDGETVAVSDFVGVQDNQVALWHYPTATLLRTIPKPHVTPPHHLAVSPDGRLLATAGGASDPDIHLWELATGSRLRSFKGPDSGANRIAFSPDGRLLASGGLRDKAVRVWDVLTGKELARFEGHHSPVYCVAFSPDGQALASGSADTTVLLWDVRGLRGKPARAALEAKELEALWDRLKGDDGKAAWGATLRLVGAGDQAAAFLGKRLRPVPAPDPAHLAKRVADLNSGKFSVRQAASKELERLGRVAEPAVRARLAGNPSLEEAQRLRDVLAKLAALPQGEELRRVRAVQVLEFEGGGQARAALRRLARGAPGATLTRAAQAALHRLERFTSKP
jgi:WD40 repeat protein